MVMNFSANLLGMDNAATAFGLRAMRALNTLNANPGVATNAMVLFLAINTAGISAFPVNVVAARAAIDLLTAGRIIVPTILVTLLSIIVAILWTKLFERLGRFAPPPPAESKPAIAQATDEAKQDLIFANPNEVPADRSLEVRPRIG